jgi:hypothetical protein
MIFIKIFSLIDRRVGKRILRGMKNSIKKEKKIIQYFYPKFGCAPAETFGINSPCPVTSYVFMVLEFEAGSLIRLEGTVKYPMIYIISLLANKVIYTTVSRNLKSSLYVSPFNPKALHDHTQINYL